MWAFELISSEVEHILCPAQQDSPRCQARSLVPVREAEERGLLQEASLGLSQAKQYKKLSQN